MSGWPSALATALQFLTRLPIPGGASADPAIFPTILPRALALFPLVGALIGAATAAVLVGAAWLWPLPIAVLLALAVEARLTGALHEDAVADMCDGLGGGRDAEHALAIMKDSRIGAFGVLGLGLAVALRACALMTMADVAQAAVALVVAGAVARLMMLATMAAVPPIPGREGLGGSIAAAARPRVLALGGLAALPALALGLWWDAAATLLGLLGAALTLAWLRRLLLRRLGGLTGDALGFAGYAAMLAMTLAFALRG
jgi:adenosylcobinamide-GDP ribazoletransferase